MLRRVVLSLSIVFVSMPLSAADIADADAALLRGDYGTAVQTYTALSNADNATAMTRLAGLYQRGEGVDRDSQKAAALYTSAAKLGNAEAQFHLGNMYLLGEGLPQDDAWALTYFRLAAKQGHAPAAQNMRQLYLASGMTPPTAPTAVSAEVPTKNAQRGASAVIPVTAQTAKTQPVGEEVAAGDRTGESSDIASIESKEPLIIMLAPVERPTVEPVSADEAAAIRLAQEHGIEVALDDAMEPVAVEPNSLGPAIEGTASTGVDSFEAARRALAAGNFEQARAEFTTLAEGGHGEAALLLAEMAERGDGGPPEPALAVTWLRRAAVLGNAQAQYRLAERYLQGRGMESDDAMAITLYRDAAQAGHPLAQEKLRTIYLDAGLPAPDFTGSPVPVAIYSAPPLEKPAQQGSASATPDRPTVANAEPKPPPPSSVDSISGRAAEQLTVPANGQTEDPSSATVPHEAEPAPLAPEPFAGAEAAKPDKAELATVVAAGPVQREVKSVAKIESATTTTSAGEEAALDEAIAEAKLALAEGRFDAAASTFKRLAKEGNAEAQSHLGYMYYIGEGVEADPLKAVDWYRRAAAQGNRDAQYNLAVAYAFGKGVERDDGEAVNWYRRAADQGSAIAQYSLAISYARGEGVARDDGEAFKWYFAAAEQGYAPAQYSLGYVYRSGRGVERNLDEAVKWYNLAAAQGHSDARADLASLEYR